MLPSTPFKRYKYPSFQLHLATIIIYWEWAFWKVSFLWWVLGVLVQTAWGRPSWWQDLYPTTQRMDFSLCLRGWATSAHCHSRVSLSYLSMAVLRHLNSAQVMPSVIWNMINYVYTCVKLCIFLHVFLHLCIHLLTHFSFTYLCR